MSVHDAVAAFAAAVTRPDAAPPAGLRVARGDLASRFAVYRNNVAVARIGVFADLFPVCRRLVGEDFFTATVRAHLADRPPSSPIVATWGDGFADWLALYPETRDFDWLVDMARLEAARVRAHHAAEAEPLAPTRLTTLAPEALLGARPMLHPSLAIVASAHPIGTIWALHRSADEPVLPTDAGPETVLVVRPEAEVRVEVIGPGDAAWLARLVAGETLAVASEAALAVDAGFDLGVRLVALIRLGAVVDLA